MPRALDPQTTARHVGALMPLAEEIYPLVEGLYVDLHHNPELSGQEVRTAKTVAEWLARAGYEVHTGLGGTGVAGVLRNGEGPTVLLRGDMDALPLEEKTGLPYASNARGVEPDGTEVPVMHACGHDAHTACLLGAADMLSSSLHHWRGTVVIVAQPAEELMSGARAMLDDGLYERCGRPDVALAQHLSPRPAGQVAHREGPLYAACASFHVRVAGVGAHAARPHASVDPVLIAANIITRLQTIVSRETDPLQAAVVTVGRVQAGTRANIIPDEASLDVDVRTFDEPGLEQLEEAVRRIVAAEAQAAGAPHPPDVTVVRRTGVTRNEPEATGAVAAAHRAYFGGPNVVDAEAPLTASEDFSEYALPSEDEQIPTVYWLLGATPREAWDRAEGETAAAKLAGVPGAHTPYFAPEREPTLRAGMAALMVGALSFVGTEDVPDGPMAADPAAVGALGASEGWPAGIDADGPAPTQGSGMASADPEDPGAPFAPGQEDALYPSGGLAEGPSPSGPSAVEQEPAAWTDTPPEESTQEADMASLLHDGEGEEPGASEGAMYPDIPAPPPSGPAFAGPPPPQGPPIAAPPPPGAHREDDTPYEL